MRTITRCTTRYSKYRSVFANLHGDAGVARSKVDPVRNSRAYIREYATPNSSRESVVAITKKKRKKRSAPITVKCLFANSRAEFILNVMHVVARDIIKKIARNSYAIELADAGHVLLLPINVAFFVNTENRSDV